MVKIFLTTFLFLVLQNPVFSEPMVSPDSLRAQNKKIAIDGQLLGPGVRLARHSAVGKIAIEPLNYVQILVVGMAVIVNNNDNDGQPGTFTGGSASNMASGG